ncbi:unnamed protein product [Arctogadus glacialis]
MPFIGNLYQMDHRSGQYYVDEGLMVAATIHTMDCTCTDTCNIHPNPPRRLNEVFDKPQTLFLIHLMGIHLAVEGEGPAKTIDDLNRRMRLGKKTKKLLWEEMAAKLSTQFGEDFNPDKVARKWLTLVQGYKKVKDHNASTGKGPGRFQFLKEMEELLGGHHDVDPPVLAGDGHGVVVRRPDALRRSNSAPTPVSEDRAPPAVPSTSTASSTPPTRAPSPVWSTSSISPSPASCSTPVPNETPRPRKRPTKQDELVAYLQSSDEERADALKRQEDFVKDTLREMRDDRRELLTQFTRTVDKM